MPRYLAAATAAVLVTLAAPAAAQALIQIDRGIGGARLNNTRAEVRAALGRPSRVSTGTNDFGPFVTYRYRGAGITVSFQGRRRVSAVSTTGRGDRTRRGVGVGSTESAVRNRVPGVHCETIAGSRSCHTGSLRAGERVTDFLIRRGRVRRVTVGFVLD
jgi:hypothetical protein